MRCGQAYKVLILIPPGGRHPGGECVSPEPQLAIIRQRLAGRRDDVEALRQREGEMLSLARIKAWPAPLRSRNIFATLSGSECSRSSLSQPSSAGCTEHPPCLEHISLQCRARLRGGD